MKKVYILLLFSLCIKNIAAQCEGGRYISKIFTQTTRTKNITYSTAKNAAGNMQAVLMDVFEPVGDTASLRPLVIFEWVKNLQNADMLFHLLPIAWNHLFYRCYFRI